MHAVDHDLVEACRELLGEHDLRALGAGVGGRRLVVVRRLEPRQDVVLEIRAELRPVLRGRAVEDARDELLARTGLRQRGAGARERLVGSVGPGERPLERPRRRLLLERAGGDPERRGQQEAGPQRREAEAERVDDPHEQRDGEEERDDGRWLAAVSARDLIRERLDHVPSIPGQHREEVDHAPADVDPEQHEVRPLHGPVLRLEVDEQPEREDEAPEREAGERPRQADPQALLRGGAGPSAPRGVAPHAVERDRR